MENRKNQLQILLPQWCVNTRLHPSASGACLSQNGKQILKNLTKGSGGLRMGAWKQAIIKILGHLFELDQKTAKICF